MKSEMIETYSIEQAETQRYYNIRIAETDAASKMVKSGLLWNRTRGSAGRIIVETLIFSRPKVDIS